MFIPRIFHFSLLLLKERFKKFDNLKISVAEIEKLPFTNNKFDFVVSSGTLSYGDNKKVMLEIHRVLKKNGIFICVDLLNNNLIYRVNRWFHYIKGNRSLRTIKQMPSISLIKEYELMFDKIETRFFGSISWLTPLISQILSKKATKIFSDNFDNFFKIKKKSAFKFVMIAKK